MPYYTPSSSFYVRGKPTELLKYCQDNDLCIDSVLARLNYFNWSFEDAVSKRPINRRPNNDEYFMRIAGSAALRSTCSRRAVGCVIVDKHYHVLSIGYNSVAGGLPHCIDTACAGAKSKSGSDLHLCEARHAEDVALMKCKDIHAIHTVYCTTEPCIHCTRRLLDTSCQRVVFAEPYPTKSAEIWKAAGRKWHKLPTMIHIENPMLLQE